MNRAAISGGPGPSGSEWCKVVAAAVGPVGAVPLLGAALALAVAVPALASGGLPRLSDLQAGPYTVALHNDSPTLVTGRNVLTLEMPSEAGSASVQLELVGDRGQALPVALRTVSVLGGGSSGHDADSMADMPDMPGMTHAAPAHSAGVPSASARSQHAQQAPVAVLLRGAVDLPEAGAWTARLRVSGPAGETYTAEAALDAVDGGPSRLYLLLTGSLIGGAVLFGTVKRRLRPSTSTATTRRTQ